jgi:acetyl esterase/lipase
MKLIYLLFVALNVWFAYNLYHPNFKSMRLMVPSFIAGWLVGELVFFVVIVQLILTILFIEVGAVNGFLGNLALIANVGAWYFYVQHYLSANDVPEVFDGALKSTFGKDYENKIAEDELKAVPQGVDIERLLKPFSLDLPDVERIKNIQFDHQDGINLRLDVYRKKGEEVSADMKKPVLFQIHGGGWTYRMGSKDEQARPLMNQMASNGWICVSVNYRLSPKATFPEHVIDCKKALTWVKEHIAEYGGDPDFIVATGGSAGGHLSSLVALSANDPSFQPGFEDQDTSVQGCVPFYGVYDFTNANDLHANNGLIGMLQKSVFKKPLKGNEEEYRQASPVHRIHEDAPPFLIIQGDADTLVSGPEAAYFAAHLDDVSKESVCYVELEGAQHAFDIFISLRSEHCKHGVQKYLAYLHSEYLKAKAA